MSELSRKQTSLRDLSTSQPEAGVYTDRSVTAKLELTVQHHGLMWKAISNGSEMSCLTLYCYD